MSLIKNKMTHQVKERFTICVRILFFDPQKHYITVMFMVYILQHGYLKVRLFWFG